MRNRITQQMLKGCGHLFQHAAIQLNFSAAQFQIHFFTQFASSLTNSAVQTFANGRERHHADGHQSLLQFTVGMRLCQQRSG